MAPEATIHMLNPFSSIIIWEQNRKPGIITRPFENGMV